MAESEDQVKEKLQRGEYVVRNNEGAPGHPVKSPCWASDGGGGTIRLIIDPTLGAEVPWVQCRACMAVISHAKKSSTNKLNRHSAKCKASDVTVTASSLSGPARPQASSACVSSVFGVGPAPVLSKCQKEFTEASINFAIANGVSFNALHGPHYNDIVQLSMDLGRLDPSLMAKDVIPHPTTISRNVKLAADRARLEILPEVRENISEGDATATTDMYTEDSTKVSYIAVTIHYTNKKGKKVNVTLFCTKFDGCHTAENILEVLKEELATLGIDPDLVEKLTFITDNGANIKLALNGYNRLHCMAHAINLVLKNSFEIKLYDIDLWGEIGVILDDVIQYLIEKCGKGRRKYVLNLVTLKPKPTKVAYRSKCPLYSAILKTFNQVTKVLEDQGKLFMLRGICKADIQMALDFVKLLEKASFNRKPKYTLRGSEYSHLKTLTATSPDATPLSAAYHRHMESELAVLEALFVVDMCKKSVTYMKQSHHFPELMRKLHQEMPVRWNSHLPMLESIHVQFEQVQQILLENGEKFLEEIKKDQLQHLINYLKPFDVETKRMQDETKPTFHLGHLSYTVLERNVTPKPGDGTMIAGLRARSLFLLRKYWKVLPEHRLAAFLMPDFKRLVGLSSAQKEEVYEFARKECLALSSMVSQVLDGSETLTADDGLDAFRDIPEAAADQTELERYLQEPPAIKADPVLWWLENAARFPCLSRLAKRLLSRPITSAPCESVFSLAGFIINARRSCLSPSLVNDMLFYNSYLRLMRRLNGLS